MDTFTQLSNYLSLDLGFPISLKDESTLSISMFKASHIIHLCENSGENGEKNYHLSFDISDSSNFAFIKPNYYILTMILENLLIVRGLKLMVHDEVTLGHLHAVISEYKGITGCELLFIPSTSTVLDQEVPVIPY
ncbi:hypothetical protein KFS98_003656 [Salmonella enterica]|nr:hypothetical protein [Salmonella enterica]